MSELATDSFPNPSPEDLTAYQRLKTVFWQAFDVHAEYIIEDLSNVGGRDLLLAPTEKYKAQDRSVLIQLSTTDIPEFEGFIRLMVHDKVDELIIDRAGLVWDRFINYEAHGLGEQEFEELDAEEFDRRKETAKANVDLAAEMNPPALASVDLIATLEGWITNSQAINQTPEASD